MITNILLLILNTFLYFIIDLFPDFTGLPTGISTTFTTIQTYFGYLNKLFPIDTLISALAILLTFDIALVSYKIFNWIVKKVRGSG